MITRCQFEDVHGTIGNTSSYDDLTNSGWSVIIFIITIITIDIAVIIIIVTVIIIIRCALPTLLMI